MVIPGKLQVEPEIVALIGIEELREKMLGKNGFLPR
jgi:hypothetical protein